LSITSVAVTQAAQSLLADASLRSIQSEIEKRHDESVERLQEWVKHPALAAEDRGMDEGCDLMMRMARDAGFQKATRIETDGHPGVFATLDAGAPKTVALYLRVSTGRQAESDLSIPDQRRQITSYCLAKGWDVAAEFVEPGNTATDDRRPAFQAMIDAALVKPPTFTVIVVHSFSRFFRDQFQFEFYVRKLAKNGVRLISIRRTWATIR